MKKTVVDFWTKKQGKILQLFLATIMVLFIGILIGVYFIARNANPIFLDENGKPVQSQTESKQY